MVERTVTASPGSSVTFLSQGAIVQAFRVGGQNLVQTFPTPSLFKTHNAPFFGETIGRVANRIAGATIDNLNGRSYRLAANNGPNCLHGGAEGWGKKDFSGPQEVTRDGKHALLYTLVSRHLDENFPGTVEVKVWYSVAPADEKGSDSVVLDVEYEAALIGDEVDETVVALTNHCYFNVGSTADITDTVADYATNLHLPVDSTMIPVGSVEPFPDLSANAETRFTDSFPCMDHCFIVEDKASAVPLDTRSRALRRLVTLSHPSTGISLEISSTEPAFQSYTGEYIDVPAVDGGEQGKGDQHGLDGRARKKRAGIAIEPSRYVDAVSRPEWRHMVLLRRGQVFGSKSRYVAWRS